MRVQAGKGEPSRLTARSATSLLNRSIYIRSRGTTSNSPRQIRRAIQLVDGAVAGARGATGPPSGKFEVGHTRKRSPVRLPHHADRNGTGRLFRQKHEYPHFVAGLPPSPTGGNGASR